MKKLKEILVNGSPEQQDKALKQALKVKFDKELRAELEKDLNGDQPGKRIRTKGRSRTFTLSAAWISIAASVLLLIGLLIWYVPVNNDPDLLVSQYLNEPMAHPGSSKGISNGSDLRSSAIASYNQGAYASAIEFYQQINERAVEDNFYLGVSFLKVDRLKDACSVLVGLNQIESIYEEEVRWYLALCLYKSADFPEARKLLMSFKQGDWKYKEANKLLQYLN